MAIYTAVTSAITYAYDYATLSKAEQLFHFNDVNHININGGWHELGQKHVAWAKFDTSLFPPLVPSKLILEESIETVSGTTNARIVPLYLNPYNYPIYNHTINELYQSIWILDNLDANAGYFSNLVQGSGDWSYYVFTMINNFDVYHNYLRDSLLDNPNLVYIKITKVDNPENYYFGLIGVVENSNPNVIQINNNTISFGGTPINGAEYSICLTEVGQKCIEENYSIQSNNASILYHEIYKQDVSAETFCGVWNYIGQSTTPDNGKFSFSTVVGPSWIQGVLMRLSDIDALSINRRTLLRFKTSTPYFYYYISLRQVDNTNNYCTYYITTYIDNINNIRYVTDVIINSGGTPTIGKDYYICFSPELSRSAVTYSAKTYTTSGTQSVELNQLAKDDLYAYVSNSGVNFTGKWAFKGWNSDVKNAEEFSFTNSLGSTWLLTDGNVETGKISYYSGIGGDVWKDKVMLFVNAIDSAGNNQHNMLTWLSGTSFNVKLANTANTQTNFCIYTNVTIFNTVGNEIQFNLNGSNIDSSGGTIIFNDLYYLYIYPYYITPTANTWNSSYTLVFSNTGQTTYLDSCPLGYKYVFIRLLNVNTNILSYCEYLSEINIVKSGTNYAFYVTPDMIIQSGGTPTLTYIYDVIINFVDEYGFGGAPFQLGWVSLSNKQEEYVNHYATLNIPTTSVNEAAGGSQFSILLKTNGTAWAWGYNQFGKLGNNSTDAVVGVQYSVCGNHNFCQISSGIFHTIALDSNGRVWGWGRNGYPSIIGDGTSTCRSIPVAVYGNHTFCQITSAGYRNHAIDNHGYGWSWGTNLYGELSIGHNTTSTPFLIDGNYNRKYAKIVAGGNHTIAIDELGDIYSWGSNLFGELGNNTTTSEWNAIAATQTGMNLPILDIAAGGNVSDGPGSGGPQPSGTSFAIDSIGKLWAWGNNYGGQLGDNTVINKSIPVAVCGNHTFCKISAAIYHTLAIDNHGYAWSWGYNYGGQLGDNTIIHKSAPVLVYGNHTFCKIYACYVHSFAIDNHGILWGWGANSGNQVTGTTVDIRTPTRIGNPTEMAPPKLTAVYTVGGDIQSGYGTTYKLYPDGSIWAWGNNTNGQLGNNSSTGTIYPVRVVGNHTFCQLSGPRGFFVSGFATDNHGKAWMWGSNWHGTLGNNSTTQTSSPTPVCGNHTFCQIAKGGYHATGLDNYGNVWGWGYNNVGQLGNNSVNDKSMPISVCGNHTFCAISNGYYLSFGIDNSGLAWGWGDNSGGVLGDNSFDHRSVPVPVCGNHTFCKIKSTGIKTIAIDNHGQAWSWGYNANGGLGNNSTIDVYTPIRVCGNHTFCQIDVGIGSLAIDNHGQAWGWGYNVFGQLGDNSSINKSMPVPVFGNHTFCRIWVGGQDLKTTFALDNQGKSWGWGFNLNYELTNNYLIYTKTPVLIKM